MKGLSEAIDFVCSSIDSITLSDNMMIMLFQVEKNRSKYPMIKDDELASRLKFVKDIKIIVEGLIYCSCFLFS